MTTKINTPFVLRSGHELPNRLVKGAMSEHLARADHEPNELHRRLYHRWAQSGCGLLISGNVMVDRLQLEGPGNVVVDGLGSLDALRAWRRSARNGAGDIPFWLQVNHPGRQSPGAITPEPVSASAIPPRDTSYYRTPRALTDAEINTLPALFARTAELAQRAGFEGIQIHACYGYLLSSFLSPRANHRTDRWGGTPENRQRLLFATVRAVREAVGNDFALGVKVNCSDYLPGGLTKREALDTILGLDREGVDLIDLSGGSMDKSISFATRYKRPLAEDLFLPMAKAVKKAAPNCPLMITGNVRSGEFMQYLLTHGYADVIGLARPLLVDVDFPHKLLEGFPGRAPEPQLDFHTDVEIERVITEICWYYEQIHRLGRGEDIALDLDVNAAAAAVFGREDAQSAEVVAARSH